MSDLMACVIVIKSAIAYKSDLIENKQRELVAGQINISIQAAAKYLVQLIFHGKNWSGYHKYLYFVVIRMSMNSPL